MNHHLLHLCRNGREDGLPWDLDLNRHGIVVHQAHSLSEAVNYRRAYPLVMILIDIVPDDEAAVETVRTIAQTPAQIEGAPLVGLMHGPLEGPQLEALAQAGLDDIVSHMDPGRFLLFHLTTLVALNELRQFAQTRMDVSQLAHHTRECLHELSQPLSAVQGRLQLLAARCSADDPNAQCLNELVKLIMQVSQHVGHIHEIHRRFS